MKYSQCVLGAILLVFVGIMALNGLRLGSKPVVFGDFFVEDYARHDLEAWLKESGLPDFEERFVKNGPILRISVFGTSEEQAQSRFDMTVDRIQRWGRERAVLEVGEPTNRSAVRGPYLIQEEE